MNKNSFTRRRIAGQVFAGAVFAVAFGALTYSLIYSDRNTFLVGLVSGIVMLAVLTAGYRYNKCMLVAESLENITVLVRHRNLVISGSIKIIEVGTLTKFMKNYKTLIKVNNGLMGLVRRQCMVALSAISEDVLRGNQLSDSCGVICANMNQTLIRRYGVELQNAHVWTNDRECYKVNGAGQRSSIRTS